MDAQINIGSIGGQPWILSLLLSQPDHAANTLQCGRVGIAINCVP
jgi:hypothetical protein